MTHVIFKSAEEQHLKPMCTVYQYSETGGTRVNLLILC